MKPAGLIALGVALGLAALSTASVSFVAVPLSLGAVACLVLAGLQAGARAVRDPYDLQELREVEEEAELGPMPEVGMAEGESGTVTCPHCLNPYRSELPICPDCKR